MTIYIGADHRGLEAKKSIMDYLKGKNIDVVDAGLPNDDLDDYPDFAFKVGKLVSKTQDSLGILICGNGVGMCIAANKVKGVRCVRAVDKDDAYKGKNHNGANVIALGANLDINILKEIIDTFILTDPAKEERHLKRINKIINYENGEYNEL